MRRRDSDKYAMRYGGCAVGTAPSCPKKQMWLISERGDTMKKMLFIYNPNAGTGVLKPKLSDVLDVFTKSGYEITIYPTQKPHDAVEKIRERGGEYDRPVWKYLRIFFRLLILP